MTAYRTTVTTLPENSKLIKLPEVYEYSPQTRCPFCGFVNEYVGFHTKRTWKPLRWWLPFRKFAYHKCRCFCCEGTWKELPCGRDE